MCIILGRASLITCARIKLVIMLVALGLFNAVSIQTKNRHNNDDDSVCENTVDSDTPAECVRLNLESQSQNIAGVLELLGFIRHSLRIIEGSVLWLGSWLCNAAKMCDGRKLI